MRLLALDTSTDACSVAVDKDGPVAFRHEVAPREHTRLLVPMIREVLAEAGLEVTALDGIVLGNGPGSFIGMRIAASVAQGLAFAAGIPVVPVSSLAAVAAEAFAREAAARVLVAQDAHMHEVYLAEFERDDAGLPVPVAPVRLHPVGTPVIAGSGERAIAAGAGWERYPGLLERSGEALAGFSPIRHPHALRLLTLGRREWAAGRAVRPEAITPEYVRTRVVRQPPPS